MIGLSPRLQTSGTRQEQTSMEVHRAVPRLPRVITDLISQMAVTYFAPAFRAVELDKDGAAILNDRNKETLSCIELALTASSTECDPTVKTIAFLNATDNSTGSGDLRPYMVKIINDIGDRGMQINLDDVSLYRLNLTQTSTSAFKGMSARRATFEKMNLGYLKLSGADFTGAKFIDTSLEFATMEKVIITNASFSGVSFDFTMACELTGNQSGILERTATVSEPMVHGDRGRIFSMTTIEGDKVSARPDREMFILPASKILSQSTQTS